MSYWSFPSFDWRRGSIKTGAFSVFSIGGPVIFAGMGLEHLIFTSFHWLSCVSFRQRPFRRLLGNPIFGPTTVSLVLPVYGRFSPDALVFDPRFRAIAFPNASFQRNLPLILLDLAFRCEPMHPCYHRGLPVHEVAASAIGGCHRLL